MEAAFLEWTEPLATGIAEIDEQHRELFRCADRVREAALADDAAALDRNVAFLREYVEEHFRAEEAYMATRRYPGLARHQLEHAALRDAVLEIEADHRLRALGAVSRARVERFLSDWLRTHIGLSDLAFAHFARRARRG
jgi:hemerythrin